MSDLLTPEALLFAYSIGMFPMADPSQNNEIGWYEPEMRGIIPLDGLKVSKSLRQVLISGKYHVTMNTEFEQVMRHCANRSDTWISEEIISAYTALHELGYAFSFETRDSTGVLAGGLYGVALGRAFFGESMFHLQRDASKVALVELVNWMKRNGFVLLDTQYYTPHLGSMGCIEISRNEYKKLLIQALQAF
jgi:leucyl/phenylalanyl-tRNA--protein transferase